jgi:hypothetical protein
MTEWMNERTNDDDEERRRRRRRRARRTNIKKGGVARARTQEYKINK